MARDRGEILVSMEYYIVWVDLDSQNSCIEKVGRKDSLMNPSDYETVLRPDIIDSIGRDNEYYTAVLEDEKLRAEARVCTYERDGSDFIRTVETETLSDNLGELPTQIQYDNVLKS